MVYGMVQQKYQVKIVYLTKKDWIWKRIGVGFKTQELDLELELNPRGWSWSWSWYSGDLPEL